MAQILSRHILIGCSAAGQSCAAPVTSSLPSVSIFSLCSLLYMRVLMFVGVCKNMHIEARGQLSTSSFEAGSLSLLNLLLTEQTKLPGQQGSSCLSLPDTGITGTCHS